MPLRQQVQGLERCLHEVQVQLELSSGTVESQSSELARQRKQLKTLQESYRLDLMAAEERGDRLNTRLEVEIVKRQEREAQAARCDEALADAEAMRKEVSFAAMLLCVCDCRICSFLLTERWIMGDTMCNVYVWCLASI